MTVCIIYTADHLMDGWHLKGNSGIHRYDFHYHYRIPILIIVILLLVVELFFIIKHKEAIFIQNGFWLVPVVISYFFLKFKGYINGIAKMLVISCIVSYVVVSLYSGAGFFADFLSMERIIMTLLAFLNQLVLEYFEFPESNNENDKGYAEFYIILIKRVLLWILIFLVISTSLNFKSWPFTLSLMFASLFLRFICYKTNWFKVNRRYRFFADFALVTVWPILKLLIIVNAFFSN